MKPRSFIVLLVVCAVLAGASYWVLNQEGSAPRGDDRTGEPLLKDLPVNDITEIAIQAPEDGVRLARGSEVWEVTDRYGYPADFGKIADFVKKVRDMKIGRSFAADPETRERLALLAPEDADTAQSAENEDEKATRVTCKKKDGSVIADLLVGKAREGAAGQGGHYVMPADDSRIYLVDKDFKFMDTDPKDWLEKSILDVPAAEIREVVCTDPAGDRPLFTIRRPEKGKNPEFVDPPPDKKVAAGKLNDLFGALSGLRLDDVADPAAPPEETGIASTPCLAYHLFDGTVYTLCPGSAAGGDAGSFMTVRAGFQAPEAPAETPADERKAETAEGAAESQAGETDPEQSAAAPEKTPEELAAAAEKKDQSLTPWIFIIPKWKADRLVTDAGRLFEKPAAPAADAEGAADDGGMPAISIPGGSSPDPT